MMLVEHASTTTLLVHDHGCFLVVEVASVPVEGLRVKDGLGFVAITVSRTCHTVVESLFCVQELGDVSVDLLLIGTSITHLCLIK